MPGLQEGQNIFHRGVLRGENEALQDGLKIIYTKPWNEAPMMIDSHAHLDMKRFDKDRDQVLERATAAGLTHIVTVGIDLKSSLAALNLAKKFDFIFSTIGYHPHNAKEMGPQEEKALCKLATEANVVAWGEIGLDFFHKHSPPATQIDVFKRQIDLAREVDLPIIIHDRDAHDEVLEILKSRGNGRYRGVIHCFSGDYALALTFLDMGFYLSIPGTVTYKNAHQVREVAARTPLDRLFVETDAPFLTPVPHRGDRNEPSFVAHTVREIARLRKTAPEKVARQTAINAAKLFNLPVEP